MTEPSRPVAPLEELIARLRKMQACVYLTVEAPVARDLSEGFQQAIQTLDKLSADLAVERAQRQHLEAELKKLQPGPHGSFGYCATCCHPLDLCSHCDTRTVIE